MSFTRNTIFKKRISAGRGYEYTLYFVPGDSQYLTMDESAAIELPHNLVFNGISIKENYNDDMPLGLPQGSVLTIKLNLAALEDKSNGQDWSTVRDWILGGVSTSKRDFSPVVGYYGKMLSIPNRWYIKRTHIDTPGEKSILFEGVQEKPRQVKVNNKGEYEIHIAGIARSAFGAVLLTNLKERLDIILPGLSGEPKWVRRQLHEYYGPFEDGRYYTCENPREDWEFSPNRDKPYKYYACSLTGHLLKEVFNLAEYFLQAYRRLPFTDPDTPGYQRIMTQSNNIFCTHSFYEKDVGDLRGQPGDLLEEDDIRVIYKVSRDDTDTGGLLVDNASQDSWAREFNNAWNLLKVLAEGTLNKVRLQADGERYYFTWQPVFSSYDISGAPGEPSGLDESDFIDEASLTIGSEYKQCTATTGNVPSSNQSEFSVRNDGLGLDEGSLELVLKLHNQKLLPRSNWDGEKYDNKDCIPLDGSYNQKMFYWSDDYESGSYPEGMLISVHDWCRVKLNDTLTITSENLDGFPSLPVRMGARQKYDLYKPWAAARNTISGMAYTFAKAGNIAFNRDYQGQLEGEVWLEKAFPGMLGASFSISPEDITGFSSYFKLMEPPGNCFLTSLEADIVNLRVKVKFFFREE